jgi:hypothetical protein
VSSAFSNASIISSNGSVVVSSDEQLFRGAQFAADELVFAKNVTDWFGLSGTGSILFESPNGFFNTTNVRNYLTSLGYTVTSGTATSYTSYDAVFTTVDANDNLNSAALTSYVSGGGNVFLAAVNSGMNRWAAEAAAANAFLNNVGLEMTINSFIFQGATRPVDLGFDTAAPFGPSLFSNVNQLYTNNALELEAPGLTGWTTQLFEDTLGRGIFAASRHSATQNPSPVSEPSTIFILLASLVGLTLVNLRHKSSF